MIRKVALCSFIAACDYTASLGETVSKTPPDHGAGDAAVASPTPQWPGTSLVTTLPPSHRYGLAVAAGSLYWLNADAASVERTPLGGGAVTHVTSGPSLSLAQSGEADRFLAGDDQGLVFVTDDTTFTGARVLSYALDGTTRTLATQPDHPGFLAVALTSTTFVASTRSTVIAAPRSGGAAATIATAANPTKCFFLAPLAADASNVYFQRESGAASDGCPSAPNGQSSGQSFLAQVPIGGGSASWMPNGEHLADALTIAGARMYGWTGSPGSVEYVTSAAAVPVVHSSVYDLVVTKVAVVGDFVYWAGFVGDAHPAVSAVGCVSLSTGEVHTESVGAGLVHTLAVGPDGMYFRADCPAASNADPCPPDELRRLPLCDGGPS
ncbi:MAG TPA: hypothetical protein VGL17_12845 [Gemmatimonadaceae bacterium]